MTFRSYFPSGQPKSGDPEGRRRESAAEVSKLEESGPSESANNGSGFWQLLQFGELRW